MIGIAITIIAFAMLLSLPYGGVLSDRFGARHVVTFGMIANIAGIALVLITTHQIFYWLSMLLYGLASGAVSAAIGSYTIESLPRSKYGEGMGLQRTISDIGYVAGPIFAGVIADISGYGQQGGVVATLAAMGFITAVFAMIAARHARRAAR